MRKLCCLCKSFDYEAGQEAYSEVTPGWDSHLRCSKDHWDVDVLSEPEFRDILANKALTCPDFEENK